MKAKGCIGLLKRTMHGTQDASHLWQKVYTNNLMTSGFRCGSSNSSVFYSKELDVRMWVHGDDFVLLADADANDKVDALL
eukprot:9013465-Karenia_brevis.AAC.1